MARAHVLRGSMIGSLVTLGIVVGSELGRIEAAERSRGRRSNGIEWRTDFSHALAEGAATGRPVFADFTAEWCGYCKLLDRTTFQDAKVVGIINATFIPVKVDADRNPGVVKQFKVTGFPTAAILDSDGQLVDKLPGYRDGPTYFKDLKKVAKSLGKLKPLAGPARMKRALELAEKAVAKEHFGVAYAILREVGESDSDFAEVGQAREKADEIEQMAGKRLQNATESVESKDFAQAAALLSELGDKFAGTNAADDAKQLEERLRNDPDANNALREVTARSLYERAIEDMDGFHYGSALERLETVADKYGDSAVAAAAAKELAYLKGNRRIMQKARDEVAEPQCKVWFSLARTWRANKRARRAGQYYQKIIDTFPDTSFASEAKRDLKSLKL